MTGLKQYEHIYFLGIGGIGMSALARCCMLWGIQVSGYDRQSSVITDALVQEGDSDHRQRDAQEDERGGVGDRGLGGAQGTLALSLSPRESGPYPRALVRSVPSPSGRGTG